MVAVFVVVVLVAVVMVVEEVPGGAGMNGGVLPSIFFPNCRKVQSCIYGVKVILISSKQLMSTYTQIL